jgi:hypothetical protein
MSTRHAADIDSSEPERPGRFALIGLLVAFAAVVVGLVLINSLRLVAGALLIFAGGALAAVWSFTNISEKPRYKNGIVIILVLALLGGATYILFFFPPKSVETSSPELPHLSFELPSPTNVPWCGTYKVIASAKIPAGYRIIIFDSAADSGYNFSGPYNYDHAVSPVGRVPDEYVTQNVYVGDKFKTVNGKSVLNVGFTAVIIAVIVPDKVDDALSQVRADPKTGWGLHQLPDTPTEQIPADQVLDVQRNQQIAVEPACLKH